VKLVSPGPTETARTAPFGNFGCLATLGIKLWCPLPVATLKNYSKKRPGMIMYIIRITLEKLVYKDVEWKSISISKEHIVAFQIGLVFHTVHNYTVPSHALKEFFKHVTIIQDLEYSVKKNPAVSRGFQVPIGIRTASL
jgi:hypothetical protein